MVEDAVPRVLAVVEVVALAIAEANVMAPALDAVAMVVLVPVLEGRYFQHIKRKT